MSTQPVLGVIGGSGLYGMPGLSDVEERTIATPYGDPSDAVVLGTLAGQRVAFLARHGRGHRHTPTEVNYRANIWALKSLGLRHVVAVSACGSLREDYAPGHIVIPDQVYDRTTSRERTFVGGGLVAHVSVADPFCPQLSAHAHAAVAATGATVHQGGTFVTIEGPRFSTRAESHMFRAWGADIINMSIAPECALANEAGLPYAAVAMSTDYDCWKDDEEPVTWQQILDIFEQNVEKVVRVLVGTIAKMREPGVSAG
jgi:5'-methylthioadenosine phosphorylase